jgi:hypothetical protein
MYIPSQVEIAEETGKIRSNWSEKQFRMRKIANRKRPYTIPTVRVLIPENVRMTELIADDDNNVGAEIDGI